MIPDWEADTVVISDVMPERHPEIVHRLKEVLGEHHIPLTSVAGMADVWIRDAAPVQVDDDRFIQFRYWPDYLRGGYEQLITGPEAFQKIDFFRRAEKSDVILDGGNIVGTHSVAIVTDKVFRENPNWSRNELRVELRNVLQVHSLIVIPKEPYDHIGHSDGMVRFVADGVALVNDYWSLDSHFATRLERVLKASGLQTSPLPYVPENVVRDGIHSAVGNYVNFLRVGDLIVVPAYGIPEDDAARAIVAKQLREAHVVSLPCRELAEAGGVLNCAIWTGRLPSRPANEP